MPSCANLKNAVQQTWGCQPQGIPYHQPLTGRAFTLHARTHTFTSALLHPHNTTTAAHCLLLCLLSILAASFHGTCVLQDMLSFLQCGVQRDGQPGRRRNMAAVAKSKRRFLEAVGTGRGLCVLSFLRRQQGFCCHRSRLRTNVENDEGGIFDWEAGQVIVLLLSTFPSLVQLFPPASFNSSSSFSFLARQAEKHGE